MKHISKLIILLAFIVSSNAWGNLCAVNQKDSNGNTPLMRAAWDSDKEAVRNLINNGANINYQDEDDYNKTIIMSLAILDRAHMIEFLIELGADVNLKHSEGGNALTLAARNNRIDSFKLLLKAGADIHVRSTGGRTALMWAAWRGNNEMVKLLLKAGANIDAQDKDGKTALYHSRLIRYNVYLGIRSGTDKLLLAAKNTPFATITLVRKVSERIHLIHWDVDKDNSTEFKLEYSTSLVGPWTSVQVAGNSRNYFLFNLPLDKVIYIKIQAKNNLIYGKPFILTKRNLQ